MQKYFRLSLEAQIAFLLITLITLSIFIVSFFNVWLNDIFLAAILSSSLIIPISFISIRYYFNPVNRILCALNDGFQNFIDNDFSISLAETRHDELGEIVKIYNRVGEVLRNERLHLHQRELLLDTVIQTTPLSLILVDDSDSIIYSNNAARQLFFGGKLINGFKLKKLLSNCPKPFLRAVESGLNGLFTISSNDNKDNNETYHLAQNHFSLNGRQHQLYLFKSLTKEINRQEVKTWKKVIRLISHELNNSLAPISSLAHSGKVLSTRHNDRKLVHIFNTIDERAGHLHTFIEGYATFSRLPKPQKQMIDTLPFFIRLQQIKFFNLDCDKKPLSIYGDPAQLQQVIINLIKNADETNSEKSEILLKLKINSESFEIQIKDRGNGMSENNLSNALLPFYSTKANGTGLGLPLCREIVEAHGGKMMISNRHLGGLKVTLIFPNQRDK